MISPQKGNATHSRYEATEQTSGNYPPYHPHTPTPSGNTVHACFGNSVKCIGRMYDVGHGDVHMTCLWALLFMGGVTVCKPMTQILERLPAGQTTFMCHAKSESDAGSSGH